MNRIKAIIEHGMVGNDIELRILGLPFGGHSQGKDRHRQFFDMKTDFQMEPGDQIPATYFHGQALKKGNDPMPEFYGKATLTHFDRRGGWFEMTVPEGAKHHQRISNALEENRLRASTGVAGILARFEQNGHATLWVPGELSIVDADSKKRPANELAVALPALKAMYQETGLEWDERLEKSLPTERVKLVMPKKTRITYKG